MVSMQLSLLYSSAFGLVLRQHREERLWELVWWLCCVTNNAVLYAPLSAGAVVLFFVMAVVIRLQGLRITAGSEDIRSFFTGLKIPDGGVHIIGGELEEAFIIFASDEDARRAMSRSGGCIKGSPVNLLLSSRSEMQKVLEASTKKPDANPRRTYKDNGRSTEAEPLSFGGKPSVERHRADGNPHPEVGNRSLSSGRRSQIRQPGQESRDDLYLHLYGMPFSATKEDILQFFEGLRVEDIIIFRNNQGKPSGAGMVKFATAQDAAEGLKRDREYIGSRYVRVNPSAEKKWLLAGGDSEPEPVPNPTGYSTMPSPTYTSRKHEPDRPKSRSPVPYRSRSASPAKEEFCVLVDNLSYAVEKKDLKDFFHPIPLKDDQIIHVNDKYGKRTRTALVLFSSLRDYCAGLSHHREELCNKTVNVSPVSKERMIAMLQSMNQQLEDPEEPSHSGQRSPSHGRDGFDSDRICLYVRNLPFDVRKVEIMDFFHGFRISDDSLILLRDEHGAGLGEALMIFQTENEAMMAQSLNGQRFLGSEVMLKCITRAQMREFGISDQIGFGPNEIPRETGEVRYPARQDGRPNFPADKVYTEGLSPPDIHPHRDDMPVQTFGRREDQYDLQLDHHDAFGGRGEGPLNQGFGPPGQRSDSPTCVILSNLPVRIKYDEIYDFCYGYRVIPGSVTVKCDRRTMTSSASVVFESHREALTAVKELHGRPIGKRTITVKFE
ncbi:RNA binding motif protein 12Bb isoform X1 [Alosa pseudoharengus]|uniref:RNA binding motif protein 12Bb isoform X1 n=2 Tax=Alosa pseudoharengus TaxID=34774 RepID=UPI003F8BA9B2